jgi:hypothetical protein
MHIMEISVKKPEDELVFINSILEHDSKNYHAWSYRLWLVTTYSLWNEELKQLDDLIKQDPRNNSCWNQRYRVVQATGTNLSNEVDFVSHWILQIPGNEATWNYLFALLELQKDCSEWNDKLQKLMELNNKYSLLLCYKLRKDKNILDQLKIVDPIRVKYYEWLQVKV